MIQCRFNRRTFPLDVTAIVIRAIGDEPLLRRLYDQSTPDKASRAAVHRGLGRLVKHVLRAKVVGRSAQLNPAIDLIKSHALLAPA